MQTPTDTTLATHDQSSAPCFDVVLTAEAARILEVSPETVRWWERTGRLPAVLKTGRGMRLFDRRVVQRLADERRSRESV